MLRDLVVERLGAREERPTTAAWPRTTAARRAAARRRRAADEPRPEAPVEERARPARSGCWRWPTCRRSRRGSPTGPTAGGCCRWSCWRGTPTTGSIGVRCTADQVLVASRPPAVPAAARRSPGSPAGRAPGRVTLHAEGGDVEVRLLAPDEYAGLSLGDVRSGPGRRAGADGPVGAALRAARRGRATRWWRGCCGSCPTRRSPTAEGPGRGGAGGAARWRRAPGSAPPSLLRRAGVGSSRCGAGGRRPADPPAARPGDRCPDTRVSRAPGAGSAPGRPPPHAHRAIGVQTRACRGHQVPGRPRATGRRQARRPGDRCPDTRVSRAPGARSGPQRIGRRTPTRRSVSGHARVASTRCRV